MQHFECGHGCWTWCGHPCLWDPEKSNALLFHKDGTLKTLKERGLGWDDPAPPVEEVKHTPEQRRVLAVLRKAVHGRNPDRPIPGVKAEPKRDASRVTERDARRDAAAERARRYRERQKGK